MSYMAAGYTKDEKEAVLEVSVASFKDYLRQELRQNYQRAELQEFKAEWHAYEAKRLETRRAEQQAIALVSRFFYYSPAKSRLETPCLGGVPNIYYRNTLLPPPLIGWHPSFSCLGMFRRIRRKQSSRAAHVGMNSTL
eukprot:1502229-Amphidinium_carterae.1